VLKQWGLLSGLLAGYGSSSRASQRPVL